MSFGQNTSTCCARFIPQANLWVFSLAMLRYFITWYQTKENTFKISCYIMIHFQYELNHILKIFSNCCQNIFCFLHPAAIYSYIPMYFSSPYVSCCHIYFTHLYYIIFSKCHFFPKYILIFLHYTP